MRRLVIEFEHSDPADANVILNTYLENESTRTRISTVVSSARQMHVLLDLKPDEEIGKGRVIHDLLPGRLERP